MSLHRITSRYAKSLIDLARERGSLEQVKGDFEALKKALQNRDLWLMVKSPIIHGDKKMEIFKAIFGQTFEELTMLFLKVLTDKGREKLLPEIADAFFEQYRREMKILPVKLTTATAADEDLIAAIKEKILSSGLDVKRVEVENIVNPDLIGGFQLEFGGKVLDASVSGHLNKLRHNLRK